MTLLALGVGKVKLFVAGAHIMNMPQSIGSGSLCMHFRSSEDTQAHPREDASISAITHHLSILTTCQSEAVDADAAEAAYAIYANRLRNV